MHFVPGKYNLSTPHTKTHQRQGPFHVRRGSMLSVLRVMAREASPQYAGSSCSSATAVQHMCSAQLLKGGATAWEGG